MSVTADDLLKVLQRGGRALSVRDLLAPLQLKRGDRQRALKLLEDLVAAGALRQRRDGRFQLPPAGAVVSGVLSVHRDGYAFLIREGGGADLFIPARYLAGALDGDRVEAVREPSPRGGEAGRVVRIVARARQEIVGRFEGDSHYGYVEADDPRLALRLPIPPGARGGAVSGQMVRARIEIYPDRKHPASGTVVEVLGDPNDPAVEVRSIALRYGLPHTFSETVLQAAAALPDQVGSEECRGRVDLRDLPLVTIDGETARDFDDAVAVRAEGTGRWRLWVAIADVGHYVRSGDAIDREALERGTSVYFPDRCLPMLPERLSNGICSLNPGVDRLVLVAELLLDANGQRLDSRFYEGVMCSRARLTYTEVARWLEGDGAPGAELPIDLGAMRDLARALTAMRNRRGSLDFDLPEAEIIFAEDGPVEAVTRRPRTEAHRLIEEYMLAANEAVAAHLEQLRLPLLFRVHEAPSWDKLLAFQEIAAHFGYGLPLQAGGVDPHQLQRFLAEVSGRVEERLFNLLLLRSLPQARYAKENLGHFGLAAECYCHFTSPIRRYPDLQVHRLLRLAIAGGEKMREAEHQRHGLTALAEQVSLLERRAMEAEREMVELKRCQLMLGKIGETFSGVVVGVQPFGLFVELQQPFVEGMVPVASLSDDYYQFDPDHYRLIGQRRRRIFSVGDEMTVCVRRVDPARRQIELAPVEQQGRAPVAALRGKNRQGRGRR